MSQASRRSPVTRRRLLEGAGLLGRKPPSIDGAWPAPKGRCERPLQDRADPGQQKNYIPAKRVVRSFILMSSPFLSIQIR